MKFGIALTTSVNPNEAPPAQADYAARLAALAEELGFDSVWVSDRTVTPVDLAARYPASFGPGKSNPAAQNLLEALTVLSYAAGRTQSVRLGASVLVLPFRDPVVTAKMITSLDVLSGGRVILGVGTGWMLEEFEANRASHADRGSVTDEWIDLFKHLCTRDAADYHGRRHRIPDVVFYPKPLQQPHPPIWVGGNSAAALRRTARLGDGWHGINLTPAEVAEKAAELRRLCDQCGRDVSSRVTVSLRATLALGHERRTPDGERAPLSGAPEQIRDDLRHYREAGLEYLVLSVAAQDTASTLEAVRRLAGIVERL